MRTITLEQFKTLRKYGYTATTNPLVLNKPFELVMVGKPQFQVALAHTRVEIVFTSYLPAAMGGEKNDYYPIPLKFLPTEPLVQAYLNRDGQPTPHLPWRAYDLGLQVVRTPLQKENGRRISYGCVSLERRDMHAIMSILKA